MTAFTTPRTWVTNELVTAALLNTHLRDNLTSMRELHACRAYKSGTQTVGSGSTDVITFGAESFDTDTIHDNATNNSRFSVPTGYGGYWRATWNIAVDADDAADRRMGFTLRKNAAGSTGSGTLLASWDEFGSTVVHSHDGVVIAELVAGDYVELFLNSVTEARTIQANTSVSWLEFEFLGQ